MIHNNYRIQEGYKSGFAAENKKGPCFEGYFTFQPQSEVKIRINKGV